MNGSFWKKRKAGSVFLAVLLLTTLLAGCGINEGKAEKYVQANLDLTFQGQTQEAKEILGASDSDLKKVYENGNTKTAFDTDYNGACFCPGLSAKWCGDGK